MKAKIQAILRRHEIGATGRAVFTVAAPLALSLSRISELAAAGMALPIYRKWASCMHMGKKKGSLD